MVITGTKMLLNMPKVKKKPHQTLSYSETQKLEFLRAKHWLLISRKIKNRVGFGA